jgi:para-nitrobenzyl esterase
MLRIGRTFTNHRLVTSIMLAGWIAGCNFNRPVVWTESGLVRGLSANGAQEFLGIPYATPPIGDLRWKPAMPVARWRGIREATTLPPACAQLPSPNGPGSSAEDCLYLSVYRPADFHGFSGRRQPVLIWIHGGGFLNGSGSQQDASEMAAVTDTIVVMINYRLNVFGFLALPSLSAEAPDGSSGNLGLLDQQAAMAWVQRNIAAFGGDPDHVTIAGESAGGGSVCFHLASPTAAGLFDRAVIQSGAFDLTLLHQSAGGPCGATTLSQAEQQGLSFAASLGCDDSATEAACMRSKSAEELLAASASFTAEVNVSGAVLPVPVLVAIQSHHWNRVPIILGSNHDELQPTAALTGLGYPLNPALYEIAVNVLFGADAAQVLAEYPAANYPDPAFALGALLTDQAFACPTNKLRLLLSALTPTYGYEFDDPNAPPGVEAGMPSGAYHSADVQYLFGYTPSHGALSPEQTALSRQMIRYWGAFADRGRPEVRDAPRWPRFDAQSPEILSLRPEGSTAICDFVEFHHCSFWSSLPL